MENYNIRELEDKIIDAFNSSDVYIEAKRLIAQNVLNLLTKQSDKVICEEIKILREQEKTDIKEA